MQNIKIPKYFKPIKPVLSCTRVIYLHKKKCLRTNKDLIVF